MTDLVVVGAGVTGLAAAYEALRAGARVLVFEAAQRPGGVVLTERVAGGWVVEGGPDSFLASDGGVQELARDVGIEHRIVTLSAHGSALWTGDSLRALSEGEAASLLGIQAKPEDLSTAHASFTAGMEELIQALAVTLGTSLRLGVEVESVDLSRGAIAVRMSDGSQVTSAALVLAAPSWRVADLVRAHAPVSAGVMQRIRYLPSLTVSLAYRAAQIGVALVGTGFVVQESAAPPLRACTFASLKFPGRAPAGHVLLRAFLSGTDQRAETVAHEALAAILQIEGPPLWSRVYEWPRGIPLYSPDHAARLADARRELDLLGSVALAGAGYDGAGVGACIKSGREAARKLMARSGSSVH